MNIIELAQECQLIGMRPHLDGIYLEALEKFAALVAAAARADEREKSLKLWMLLDDIDTADDIAKTDDVIYRRSCRNIQQKRWAVLNASEVEATIRARGTT